MNWLQYKMDVFQTDQREENLPDFNDSGTFSAVEAFQNKANSRQLFTDGNWHYQIEMHPLQDQDSAVNILEPRVFTIRSTAFLGDRPIRTIDVLVRQKTFAMFGFLDSQSQGSTRFKLTGTPQIFGPVHTNGWFNFDASSINWASAQPYFEDVVTHSQMSAAAPTNGDGNVWTGSAPYDVAGSTAERYKRVFKGGRNDLRLKNSITLPTNTSGLAALANPSQPNAAGVHISRNGTNFVNGGIYVNGDVGKLNLRLDKVGNQQTVIAQLRTGGSNVVSRHVHNSSCPRHTENRQRNVSPCVEYYPLDGGAGGVSGPPAAPQCKTWTREDYQATIYDCGNMPLNDTYSSAYSEPYETHVYEVTEGPVTVKDQTGANVVASVGKTLIVNQHMNTQANGKPWVVDSVEVLDGQINGTIYVNGNIGKGDAKSTDSNNNMKLEGLSGITKGSAIVKANGEFVLDSHGERTYNNKTIATPLTNSIAVGGDLLQFNQKAFTQNGGASHTGLPSNRDWSTSSGSKNDWMKAAIDPAAADPIVPQQS